MPIRMVYHQPAEDERMVLRIVAAGIAAFIDVEQMHASD